MLEIDHAKEISGKISLPPNPDYFFLTLCISLASETSTRLSPIPEESPLIKRFKNIFSNHLIFTNNDGEFYISNKEESEQKSISLPYHELPYRDFIVFLLLGSGNTLIFDNLPDGRLTSWQNHAKLCSCSIQVNRSEHITALTLGTDSLYTDPEDEIDSGTLHCCIGLALGLRKSCSFNIDHQFQSPTRHILPAFGYEPTIKSNYDKKGKSQLEKRLRFLTPRKLKKSDSKMSFTLKFDFSIALEENISITIPGDDILAATILVAKSLVQKGQLFISNMPLEPWSCATLNYLRRMGSNPGIQEDSQTSFGASGVVSIQKFKLAGYKIDCKPLYHFIRHLPAMVVLATFAKGQTVFRTLEDLRIDTPDPIEQLLSCVRLLGGRHGEMPDGIVIDGAKDYDGFDVEEPISAALSGALAVAGLKCTGKTTIADKKILDRWPSFKEILDSVCKYRN